VIGDLELHSWHRTLLVGAVGAVSLAAWVALWRYGPALHAPVHHHGAGATSFGLLFVGAWTVMTMAMMLPTSVPLVATFHTIAGQRADRPLLVALVIVGYLAVWALLGVLFYAGGAIIQNLAWWRDHAPWSSAAILLVAGGYQFTPLKYRCLDKCRSPLSFVLGYWRGEHDRRNAFRLGAHHGLFCVGCCWALMLLMFAVGVGNIAWMLVLGAVMAVEKNVSWGRRISAPVGLVLILGGVALFAAA
jgi:predicted metal-binding membrane protein